MCLGIKNEIKEYELTLPSESKTSASSPVVDCIVPDSHCLLGRQHQTGSF